MEEKIHNTLVKFILYPVKYIKKNDMSPPIHIWDAFMLILAVSTAIAWGLILETYDIFCGEDEAREE